MSNAITHGENGSPVEIAVRDEGADAVLRVANQGPAIPAAALPTLFDPFVGASSGTHRQDQSSGGIGLGLYIARQIVVAHRGTISVESSDAAGTVVTVRLPRHQAEPRRESGDSA